MLNFYLAFEKIVEKWPANTTISLSQISDMSKSSIARTVDAVSTSLSREFDVNESISVNEAKQVLASLKDRLHNQIVAREKKIRAERDIAIKAYDLAMDKIRVLLQQKDTRTAYRTMFYLLGKHEKSLPYEIVASLCGDCLRLGSRSGATIQELGTWLRKAVDAAVASGSPDSLEDALDFLDTYRDIFVGDSSGIGEKIINNALAALSLPVQDIALPSRMVM